MTLETWAAVGAKFRGRCRRGVSQSQNISRGVRQRINEGLSLEEVLTTEGYRFADSSWRLCDSISGPILEESTLVEDAPAEDPPLVSEEPILVEDAPAASSSSFIDSEAPATDTFVVPEPPAAKRRRLPRDGPQPVRPTWIFAEESVRFFSFNPGTRLWEQVDRLQQPTATRDGVLAVDYHQVLDRTSGSEPVRGAPVPSMNLDTLAQAKREAPHLHNYCRSQLISDNTLGNLLRSFRTSVGIEGVIDHLIVTADKTGPRGKNAFIAQVCNPSTALLIDDHVGTIVEVEADNFGIQTIHICFPGNRKWPPGHIEYRTGLVECLPSIFAKRESASLRPRVVDR